MAWASKWNEDEVRVKVPEMFLIAEDGAGLAEYCKLFKVTPPTLKNWGKKHDWFREAVEYAQMLSYAWWEKEGRLNLNNRGYNSSLYMTNMMNRWGWGRNSNKELLPGQGNKEITGITVTYDTTENIKTKHIKSLTSTKQI